MRLLGGILCASVVACSLGSLDGFTGGTSGAPDGGLDASVGEASTSASDSGDSSTPHVCVPDPDPLPPDAGDDLRYATCGDKSGVDLLTNADNCGRCGHACGAPGCDDGRCKPTDGPTESGIESLGCAFDAANLYCFESVPPTDPGGNEIIVRKTALVGPSVTTTVGAKRIPDTQTTLVNAFVDQGAVYAVLRATGGYGHVFAQPLDGSDVEDVMLYPLLPMGSPGGAVRVADGFVYTSPSEGLVAKYYRHATAPIELAADRSRPFALAATPDGSRVFWTESSDGVSWPDLYVRSDRPRRIATAVGNITALLVDASHVYFFDDVAGRVLRLPLETSAETTPEVFAERGDERLLGAFAQDTDHVYWFASAGGGTASTLFARSKCGGPITVLLENETSPHGLVATDTALIWGAPGHSAFRVLAK